MSKASAQVSETKSFQYQETDTCCDPSPQTCVEEKKCEDPCDSYDANKIGMWICAIILIIIFTAILFCGFTSYGGSDRKEGDCGEGKGRDRGGCGGYGGAGIIGGILLWLIVIIIFVVATYKCGWGAIIAFLVLLIFIAIIAWWWLSCDRCDDKKDCKEKKRRDC